MSNYSDFELKIIAQASKEVNDSPNYRVLEKLKRFMRADAKIMLTLSLF